MLQLSKKSQSQKILGEITCVLYSMWTTLGFGGILLAETKVLVMLYLFEEELQVQCYVTDYL